TSIIDAHSQGGPVLEPLREQSIRQTHRCSSTGGPDQYAIDNEQVPDTLSEANEPNAQTIERHAGREQATGAKAVHNVTGERLQESTQPDIRCDNKRNRFPVRPQIGDNGFEKAAHRRARAYG